MLILLGNPKAEKPGEPFELTSIALLRNAGLDLLFDFVGLQGHHLAELEPDLETAHRSYQFASLPKKLSILKVCIVTLGAGVSIS